MPLFLVGFIFRGASAQQQSETFVIDNIDSLQTTIDSLLTENKIPGAGLALIHKDSVIWSGGIGFANFLKRNL